MIEAAGASLTRHQRSMFEGAVKALRPRVSVISDARRVSVMAETAKGVQWFHVPAAEIEAFGAVTAAVRVCEMIEARS